MFRITLVALGVGLFARDASKGIRAGAIRPFVEILGFEEVRRADNSAHFWGIVALNGLVLMGFIYLMLVVAG
jgi:hypothetical protein